MYVRTCVHYPGNTTTTTTTVLLHTMWPSKTQRFSSSSTTTVAWGFQSWKLWMFQSQSSSRNLTHQNHTRPCYTLRHICHRFSIVDNPLVICKHRTTCSNCQTICHRSPYHCSPHLPWFVVSIGDNTTHPLRLFGMATNFGQDMLCMSSSESKMDSNLNHART